MAMINPPVEVMFEKAKSRYALVTAVSKKAKELLIERPEFFKDNQKVKPIELASNQFYNGEYTIERTKIEL